MKGAIQQHNAIQEEFPSDLMRRKVSEKIFFYQKTFLKSFEKKQKRVKKIQGENKDM